MTPIDLGPQCCDANGYLAIGFACAARLEGCWNPLRPIGAGLYYSIPFRLGLPPGSLIFVNVLLLATSIWAGVVAIGILFADRSRLFRTVLAALHVGFYALSIGMTVTNSLSDVPATVFVLTAIWLLVIGKARDHRWPYVAAGGALGVGAFVRAFYLYPALVVAIVIASLAVLGRLKRDRAALFIGLCLLPIAIQYGVTHYRTGQWTYIDQRRIDVAKSEHFDNAWYGYDTILGYEGMHKGYSAAECFPGNDVMSDAIRKRDVRALGCLLVRRQWFYFGSYVPGGRTYLWNPEERRFSRVCLTANALALLAAFGWSLRRARRGLLAVPVFLLAVIWGEASFIVPESRFLMAFQIVVWTFALAGFEEVARLVLPRRLHTPASAPSVPSAPSSWSVVRAWLAPRQGLVLMALALCVTAVVHGVAIFGEFDRTDLMDLYQSQSSGMKSYAMQACDGHHCSTVRLATLLLHTLFGLQPSGFYAVVLMTHLASVGLIYSTAKHLGSRPTVAALVAAIWGSASWFQETLRPFSGYSNVIAVAALLWSLREMARARAGRRSPTGWALVRTNVALCAGAAAGPNGFIAAIAFFLVAYLMLPPESAPRRTATLLLPAAVFAMALTVIPSGTARNWDVPSHAPSVIALSPLLPFIVILAIAFVRLRRGDWTERRLLLSGLGLAGATYGSLALQALSRSHQWSAALAGYDASAPLAVAGALAINRTQSAFAWPPKRGVALVLAGVAIGWAALSLVATRSVHVRGEDGRIWARDWGEVATGFANIMLRRVPAHEVLYLRNDVFRPALDALGRPRVPSDFPGIGAYWVLAEGTHGVADRTIRFVEQDPVLLGAVRARSVPDVAAMFVSPDEVARVNGTVQTLEADAQLARFLALDPVPGVHDGAILIRMVLRLYAVRAGSTATPYVQMSPIANHFVTRWEPEELVRDAFGQFPSVMAMLQQAIAGNPEATEMFRQAIASDPVAAESLRKAIVSDPVAAEALRKAIAQDPAAMDALRRKMQGVQHR